MRRRLLCLGLVLVFLAVLSLTARRLSQTFDEADHLLAGYRYWTCGDFGVNPEHPPLAKLIAALPLVLRRVPSPETPCGESLPTTAEDFAQGEAFLRGREGWLYEARLAASSFSLLAALVLYLFAQRLGGPHAAVLSLAFFVFEPTIVAHSALVTTDMALTAFLLASLASWERALRGPRTVAFVVLTGLCAGLCLASKHSGVLVLPLLALEIPLVLKGGRERLRALVFLFAVGALALSVLWGVYGFRFDPRGRGHTMSLTLARYSQRASRMAGVSPHGLDLVLALDRARLLPESYLYGTANVLIGSASGGRTFLFGRLYPTGQWFYFPAAILVKWTLGFMGAFFLALGGFRKPTSLLLLVPALVYILVSMTSHMNIGIRHLLPAFPLLCIFVGLEAASFQRRALVYVLLALHAASSLTAFPDFLAYSNEIFGGVEGTHRFLSDSNVDWGQGLKEAKRYLAREGISDCFLAYLGTANPKDYGVPCRILPGGPNLPAPKTPETLEGTVLVSAGLLSGIFSGPGPLNPFEPFQEARPVGAIGGSLLVFRGRFETPLLSAQGHLQASRARLEEGKDKEAIEEAREAVRLAPQDPFAHRGLARVLLKTGATEEARGEYEAARNLVKSAPDFYRRLLLSLQDETG